MATNIIFPTEIGCWDIDNYSNTAGKGEKQLGNERSTIGKRSSVNASLIIKGEYEAGLLWDWWNLTLRKGRDNFLVDLQYYSSNITQIEVALSGKIEIKKIGSKYIASAVMLIDTGVYELLSSSIPPIPILDLSATNDSVSITITWTEANDGIVFYDLYTTGDVLIAQNISSGYVDNFTGTRDYYVIGHNPHGEAQSNTDSGTGTGIVIDPPTIDLTTNQVAHYLLNNNADDSFGTSDGTPSGGVDFQGDMANFDGVDDYIDSNYKFNTSLEGTISLWCRLSTIPTANIYLVGSYDIEPNRVYIQIQPTTGYIALGLGDTIQVSTTTIPLNENVNITVSFNLGVGKVYLNKVEILEITFTGTGESLVDHFIGSRNGDDGVTDGYVDGYISNIRFYNEAKGQTFIDALYADGYYPKPLPLPTTTGLIAHYPLTGTAEDTTGSHDGTEAGNTYVNDGELGAVSSFDGVNDYIVANAPLLPSNGIWTVCFWIKITTVPDGDNYIVSQYQNFSSGRGALYIQSNRTLALWCSSGGWASTTEVIPLNEWKFCTYENNATNSKIYLNEVETIGVKVVNLEQSNTRLGGAYSDIKHVAGTLSDVRVYNRVLEDQERIDIYNYEKNFRPINIDDGLVAYYPLAKNSLDNYYNEYDGVDTAMTYDDISGEGNGTTSVIDTSYPHPANNSSYTFSFWINPNAAQAGEISVSLGQGNISFYYDHSDPTFRGALAILDSTPAWNTTGGYAIPYGIFSHVVCVVDDTSIQLYVNTLDAGSTTFSGVYRATERNNLNIFANAGTGDAPDTFFNGFISKFRVHNKALTNERIEQIYNIEKIYFPTPTIDLTTDQVAHFLLNNNADDSFGTYDGSIYATPIFNGDSVFIRGTLGAIGVTDIGNTYNGLSTATFSIWAKLDVLADCTMIGRWGTTISSTSFALNYSAALGFYFHVRDEDGSTYLFAGSDTFANIGQLYHISATVDNGTIKIYIDGVLKGSNYLAGLRINTTTYDTYLGLYHDGSQDFTGDMSNARFYSDAKNQAFIDALYAEGYYPKPLPLPTTTGLIAHYPLTGTAEDTTGNYDGTEVGNTYVNDAEFGSVADFNGSNSLITATNPNIIGAMSISLWVDSDNTGTHQVVFCDSAAAVGSIVGIAGFGVFINAANLIGVQAKNNAASETAFTIASPITLGSGLQHLAFSWDGTIDTDKVKLYINGTLVSSVTASLTRVGNPSGNFLQIGASTQETLSYHLDGRVSDVRLYNLELTQQEITDIYNYEKNFRSIDIDDGLIAYYPLANNSLDNYYTQQDLADVGTVTYDGEAAIFDGATGYSIGVYDVNTLSISFWTKNKIVESTIDGRPTFLGTGTWVTSRIMAVGSWTQNMDNETLFIGNDDSTDWYVYIKDILDDFEPKHIVFVYDGGYKIYINGIERVVFTNGSISNVLGVFAEIGKGSWGGATRYSGGQDTNMSKFRQYNKIISPEQIEEIYYSELKEFNHDWLSETSEEWVDELSNKWTSN